MKRLKVLTNAKIYDYHNYIDNGYVVFDQDIIEVGMMGDYIAVGYEEIDCAGNIVIPGFVVGHTHLYSSFARGLSLPFNPKSFTDILEQLWWKIDSFLDQDMIYYSALMGALDQLKMGSTTLIDHHASKSITGSLEVIKKALVDRLRIRSVLAFETSDRFDVEEAIRENLSFLKKDYDMAKGLFGLHASLSLSDESLEKVSSVLNKEGIHIHVAESEQDQLDCLARYGMRVVERLEKFNLLNEKSLLVHCTHVNEHEMDIIKKYNSTIAINVTSNLNNAVGIAQIKRFIAKGIRVISGNDGLIKSQPIEYLNIFYLSHLKTKSPIGFSLDDLKQIIINTYEYANMLLKTRLGRIEKDAEADLLVIDYKPYTDLCEDNAFAHLFYGVFPGLRPKVVIANGEVLVENYEFFEDYNDLYNEGFNQSKRLKEVLLKDGDKCEFKY